MEFLLAACLMDEDERKAVRNVMELKYKAQTSGPPPLGPPVPMPTPSPSPAPNNLPSMVPTVLVES